MSRRDRHFGSKREAIATVCIYATGILMVLAFVVIHIARVRGALGELAQGLLVLGAVIGWGLVSLVCLILIETDPAGAWRPPCKQAESDGSETSESAR